MSQVIYTVRIDPAEPTFVEDGEDAEVEVFLFADSVAAHAFRDHMRDLYGVDANVGLTAIDTYDSAIQAIVERFGPSEN